MKHKRIAKPFQVMQNQHHRQLQQQRQQPLHPEFLLATAHFLMILVNGLFWSPEQMKSLLNGKEKILKKFNKRDTMDLNSIDMEAKVNFWLPLGLYHAGHQLTSQLDLC